MFVVLEGIDGSGKTSVGREVVDRLNQKGIPAEFTFEPSDLPVGKLLREVLKGEFETSAHTHALLFAADREEHLREVVIPAMEQGTVVVCDRYVFASMAYQGARGVDVEGIWEMNTALPHFRIPDLSLLLDIPPEASLLRTDHRGSVDIFETPEFLSRVRDIYLQIERDHELDMFLDLQIIDASQGFEDVVVDVLDAILMARKQ
jgi:dTMP kinase